MSFVGEGDDVNHRVSVLWEGGGGGRGVVVKVMYLPHLHARPFTRWLSTAIALGIA